MEMDTHAATNGGCDSSSRTFSPSYDDRYHNKSLDKGSSQPGALSAVAARRDPAVTKGIEPWPLATVRFRVTYLVMLSELVAVSQY